MSSSVAAAVTTESSSHHRVRSDPSAVATAVAAVPTLEQPTSATLNDDENGSNHKQLASVQKRLNMDPSFIEAVSDDQHHEPPRDETLSARDLERRDARIEAEKVLECCRLLSQHNLDGFNLLGVVADPRGPGSQFAGISGSVSGSAASMNPSSFHGRYGGNTADNAPSGTAAATASSSYFGSSYFSLESTLSSMTGQMEALNHVLEDWSKQLLEEGDSHSAGYHDDIPESQLKELPAEYENIDVTALTAYRERSGTLATSFTTRVPPPPMTTTTSMQRTPSSSRAMDSNDELIDVSDVPKDFFAVDFDLTDPATFRKILLQANENDSDPTVSSSSNVDGSVYDLFPLLPQDGLSSHLDKVELALLQQVRANSDQFFAESQRFALLQEWIQSLLQEVMQLQSTTGHLQSDMLQPMETVPIADVQRAELRNLEIVLERAEDMLLCKHSLGGVLSAQDDMTAIEQIQYGRRLLNGTWRESDEEEDGSSNTTVVELGRLHSFKAASEQLNQYEQLVVANMRDELIELFLSWNNTCSVTAVTGSIDSTGYGMNGSTTSNTSAATKAPSALTQQEQQIRSRVRDIVKALQTCKALSKTKDAYAMRLQDVIRMTVRTTVGEFASDVAPTGAVQSVAMGASSMSLTRFLDCLDMLFEQLLALLTSASSIDGFFVAESLLFRDVDENDASSLPTSADSSNDSSGPSSPATTPLSSIVATASELSSKSIAELLRLRKDAHSLVSLSEMKAIWDACTAFTLQLEKLSGSGHTATLQSTLLAQAKAFLERKHESNMSALAAALDSERWVQCEVAAGRQTALTRLCSGLSILSTPAKRLNGSELVESADAQAKRPDLEAEGTRYKVVWSCLLLVEMILNNIATAAHFPSMASGIVSKVAELLRLFNSRTTQLVLGAGAIHSHAKLKSINAKHLSLVTQCLGMIIAILPHIRTGLMAHLPKKQWTLLTSLDQIRKEYSDHNEKVLNKFVSIIGGIVEHNLAKKIPGTDFDERAKLTDNSSGTVSCCAFLEEVAANTRKMHQVLYSLLPPDHLIDTFSRIFAFIDSRVPALFIAAANIQPVFQKPGSSSPVVTSAKGLKFSFPTTDSGKRQFLLEIEVMTQNLNSLEGVRPWEFAATNVIGREIEFSLQEGHKQPAKNSDPELAEPATESPRLDENKENGNGEADGDVPAEHDHEPHIGEQTAVGESLLTKASTGEELEAGESDLLEENPTLEAPTERTTTESGESTGESPAGAMTSESPPTAGLEDL